jgi:hypothetical protein
MKTALFFLALIITGFVQSQTVLKIYTIDKSNQDPVRYATISVFADSVRLNKVFTNTEGFAYVNIAEKKDLHILCEQAAYADEEKELPAKNLNRDTLKVTIYMLFQKSSNIEEVVIYPVGVPQKIFESDRVSVDDFEILPDDRYLLLTYAKNKRKGTELYLYDGRSVQSKIPAGENEMGQELIRDYRGNPHLVTDKNVYGITANGNEVFIGGVEKDYFMTYIAPIVDTSVSKYYFSNYNPDYPAFDYFTYDLVDSSYRKIAQVEDELMMELYRSEYKWVDVRTKLWAKEMENETGIDAEIWVGASYFTQSIYYKELYAPLFKRNDTLFLFDHYKNLLFRFNEMGDVMDSIPIFYHLQPKQTGWKKLLLQDQTTGQVYVVYEKVGQYYLQRLDLVTGETKETIPLHFKYPEKIMVRSNKIYYTYREFETAQKKYLWTEKMPVEFPKVKVLDGDPLTTN